MVIQDGLKNKLLITHLIFFSTLFSSSVFAAGDCVTGSCAAKSYKGQCAAGGFDCYPQRPKGIFILSGGYGYSHVGESKNNFSDGVTYNYDVDGDVQSAPYGGIAIGGEFQFQGGIGLQVDVAYYETAAYLIKGDLSVIENDVVLQSNNYKYKLIGRQALIEFKVLSSDGGVYHPYVTLGVGEAFNTSYGFETAAVGTPLYNDNLTHSFSFTGAAGIDFDLTSFMRFGVGYRYANFGNADLDDGRFHGQTNKTKDLGMSNFNTQAWLAQLTFLV